MNTSLLFALGLVILPFPGGGMIRNQVMKRAFSMWVTVVSTIRLSESGIDVRGAGVGEEGDGAGIDREGHDQEAGKAGDAEAPAAVERAGDGRPPMVLLVLPGGEIQGEAGQILEGDEAVRAYLRDQKNGFKAKDEPHLRIRVAKEVGFRHVRRAIGLASQEGIEAVTFSVVTRHQEDDGPKDGARELPADAEGVLERALEDRRRDAQMQLPQVDPEDAPPAIKPFFIKIDGQGRVFANLGAAQELLGADAKDGRLPHLNDRLKIYAEAARLGGAEPAVQIYVEPEVRQSRVMDVLDALRRQEINSVTFTDLIDAE